MNKEAKIGAVNQTNKLSRIAKSCHLLKGGRKRKDWEGREGGEERALELEEGLLAEQALLNSAPDFSSPEQTHNCYFKPPIL